jgi:autotransporter passenger strand-loop-strand repeat protein
VTKTIRNVAYTLNTTEDDIFSLNVEESIVSGNTYVSETVGSGSLLVLSNGDTAISTTVLQGGEVYVSEGGIAVSTVVSHGKIYVSNDGTVNDTTIDSGGQMYVFEGGMANETIVGSSGRLNVSSGGTALETTVSEGRVFVYSGGTAVATIINSSDIYDNGGLYILNCGVAVSTTISSGFLEIHNEGTAISTIVNSGFLEIYNGGKAILTTVGPEGCLLVSSGGTALQIVEDGGYVSVEAGADVTFMPHAISGLILSYYVSASLHSGTTAISTTMCQQGKMDVFSGGTADATTVSGGYLYVSSGGIANATILDVWGQLAVSSGGTAVSTIVNSGGWLGVFIGGTAVSTIVMGRMYISSGGITEAMTVSGCGDLYVFSGGIANAPILDDWGELYVLNGGKAVSTTVGSGGKLYVSDGGTAVSTTFTSDGYLYVSGGGTAVSTTVVKNGHLCVSSGGTAVSTTVGSEGSLVVLSWGMADATMVNSGGSLVVSSGGTTDATTVSLDGYLVVVSGGVANSTIIGSGGCMDVCWSGTANSTEVSSGGRLEFIGGGILKGIVVVGGIMTLSGVVDANNADITFDITERTGVETVIVNNITLLNGGTYSINVAAEQAEGVYKLAGNASAFSQNVTLTVKDTNLTTMLTRGNTASIGGKDYTLNVVNEELCLTVAANDIPAPTNRSGNSTRLSWSAVEGVSGYVVEYSQDGFQTVISVQTETVGLEHYNVSNGTWQWRVRAKEGAEWAVGNNVVVSSASTTPSVVSATSDGVMDAFFVKAYGTWDSTYRARHMGVRNGWEGTGEMVVFSGENRFGDIFQGSTDENVLLLTDDANGDALFIDDIYTESKNDLGKTQARLAEIKDIRAGKGNDIVDLTSNKFNYTGGGLSVHGGLGDDTIWTNNGDNSLFGDAGNDRIVGAGGNDVLVGGSGDDSMHGGGGEDIFAFGGNWGNDAVEQLADGKVTLWFDEGSMDKWDASTLTYRDGNKSVAVNGVTAENIMLKFGDDGSQQYGRLLEMGAFDEFTDGNIFEERNKRQLA